jgi:hypothetical protein
VDLAPDPAGIDSLARQIRQTGRAYPLFDIAHLILKRPDRYQLEFRTEGNLPDGTPRQFFACNLDDTIWMTEGEAVRHVLTKHFATFYQAEKISVDPPKGTYTFVAQCGMSGIILGPPNLHDYQAKLQRLHAERFPRVPFDVFKSRVRIVRDEAVVKQWVEEQSVRYEYVCLNVPEPLKLENREAVERHFREVHLANILQGTTTQTVRSPAAREALPPPLRRLARREFDLQQRFPLKLVTRLSNEFAHRGLHFFKVDRTVLHVAVARPRFLDLEATPVSAGVKRIVDTIQNTPACTRRKLLESLGVPLPPADAAPPPPGTPETPPSPELSAIVADLHWLVHEGHVIEFANGRLELAKKPAPRPIPLPRAPRPAAPKATAEAAPAAAGTEEAAASPEEVAAPAPGQSGLADDDSPQVASETGDETAAPLDEAIPAAAGTDEAARAEANAPESDAAAGATPETAATATEPAEAAADEESKINPS